MAAIAFGGRRLVTAGKARAAAWAIAVVYLTTVSAALWLQALNRGAKSIISGDLTLLLAFTGFLVLGCLMISRRPHNSLGWLFASIGLLTSTLILATEYADYGYLTNPGSVPLPVIGLIFANSAWFPLLTLTIFFVPLLFPTGTVLSRSWRWVLWAGSLGLGVMTVLAALNPSLELEERGSSIHNPIGVEAVGNVEENAIGGALFGVLIICVAAACVQLVIRFRRSKGEERLQLKWFTFAAALVALLPFSDPLQAWLPEPLGDILFGAVVALLPVATGIAILKYRLYEIDRIINRTLVYGALTACLGMTYYVMIILFQVFFTESGSDSPPGLVVAATTLAVAALFQPARARVQRFIDHRFYRRRFDAQKTVEDFSSRLRDEIELDRLIDHLLFVVRDTMQPGRLSLWLRPPGEESSNPRSRA